MIYINISLWILIVICITCAMAGVVIALFIASCGELSKRQELYQEGYHRGHEAGRDSVKEQLLKLNKHCTSIKGCSKCMFKMKNGYGCKVYSWASKEYLDYLFAICDFLPLDDNSDEIKEET